LRVLYLLSPLHLPSSIVPLLCISLDSLLSSTCFLAMSQRRRKKPRTEMEMVAVTPDHGDVPVPTQTTISATHFRVRPESPRLGATSQHFSVEAHHLPSSPTFGPEDDFTTWYHNPELDQSTFILDPAYIDQVIDERLVTKRPRTPVCCIII